jgi:hypothetical protein
MAETISIIVAVVIMIAGPIAMLRAISSGLHGMQEPRSSGSFIASAMLEMDRFIRPSTGHIVEAQDEMKHHQDGIGGE